MSIKIDGENYDFQDGMTILQVINAFKIEHPQICYLPEVDPIETCDTCIVEVDGRLTTGLFNKSSFWNEYLAFFTDAKEAQTEAMDRILENHLLYCTVCDNNNGNCKIHNTVDMMEIEHQKYPYEPKCTQESVDFTHPFYRYDPNQCIACGQCVEACQNLQVNETLSMDWEERSSNCSMGWRCENQRLFLCRLRPLCDGLSL